MKIKVLDGDSLSVTSGMIRAVVDGEEFVFEPFEVEQALIITTDLGPFEDDMCLVIRIDSETAIFIMFEHPCYESFLFDELPTIISIDYEQIIKASQCTENAVFPIYKRTAIPD
ncbi:MAG: hypothetical protein K2N06_00345 [Oscillospiraceae bacterium]|nr:hypothetical protein [Oscillospiraceae bacterium]